MCLAITQTALPARLSVEELTIAIASEVLGATIFAWVIGNLVNLVLNLDPAERNRKSMMSYLAEYIRQVPLSSKAKQTVSQNYAFHLEVLMVSADVCAMSPGRFKREREGQTDRQTDRHTDR